LRVSIGSVIMVMVMFHVCGLFLMRRTVLQPRRYPGSQLNLTSSLAKADSAD
jgi:hypothetical protein